MADDRPSPPSSPPPPLGPSSSASGDQPDGQSTKRGKRKREEADMPQDPKRSRVQDTRHSRVKLKDNFRSRVTSDGTTKHCPFCNMNRLVAQGQYREALALTRRIDCSVRNKTKLQRFVQKTMSLLISDESRSCKGLGLDYPDVMMHLLSLRLEDYTDEDEDAFREFCGEYLRPHYTELLLKLVDKHATSLSNKRMMWRIVFRDIEEIIQGLLQIIYDLTQAGMPDFLQDCYDNLTHLVQILPATVRDDPDSDPASSLSWLLENSTSTVVDYAPMFAKAVECGLVQEAKLLYDAGAVNSAELTTVANKPEVQKMLKDVADQSEMAVFLRTALKQPRSLEILAVLQVSRLAGQDVLVREDIVRQLSLPSSLCDAVLFRPLVHRYRQEIKCRSVTRAQVEERSGA